MNTTANTHKHTPSLSFSLMLYPHPSLNTHTPLHKPYTQSCLPQMLQAFLSEETGTNCSGKGKPLCSKSKSNCLAANEANTQASMCTGVQRNTHIHTYRYYRAAGHRGRCRVDDISM